MVASATIPCTSTTSKKMVQGGLHVFAIEMTANLHSLHRPEISSQEQGCYASSVQRKRSRQTSFEQQWCNFHQAVEYESRYLLHYCIPGSGSASHIALTNIHATRESGLPPQLVSSDCRHPFRWKLLFACHKI